jgi:hypothetical protein
MKPIHSLALALLLTPMARAETMALQVLQDTWLDEMPLDDPQTPGLAAGGTAQLMVGRVGTNDATPRRRSLIQFDLSSLPSGAFVLNATISLYAFKVKSSDEVPVTVHRLTTEWVAGTFSSGGSGHSSGMNPGDATWLHTSSPVLWNTPGGDFIGAPSATRTVGEIGIYNWNSPQLTADVQSWLNGSSGNYGWLLRGDEVTPQMVKEFASTDFPDSDVAPQLIVEFTIVPEPMASGLISLTIAAAFRRNRYGRR